MKNNRKPKVVITSGYRWTYFQWFLLGLYELHRKGEISFRFKLPLFSQILSCVDNKYIVRLADKGRKIFEKDSYNLRGYIEQNGQKKYFVIDSADAPFLFSEKDLKSCDIYFKMQCPKNLEKDSFALTKEVAIPWCDHQHIQTDLKLTQRGERKKITDFKKYVSKIRPLMVGPRALSPRQFTYTMLKKSYDNYIGNQQMHKQKQIMCYFGNAKGPMPSTTISSLDFDWEADLMGFFKEKLNHPNEKRARIAEKLARMEHCDARIICTSFADGNYSQNTALIIPLEKFCQHIASFEYNVNVSGYRLSIPNRFIESIMVGTAILTDKLSVKWYQPFGEEVVETVSMGYLPMEQVDWAKFEQDLQGLPHPDPKRIIQAYVEKWSPLAVAKYLVDTVVHAG